jgi:hypothetical protein
MLDLKGRNEEKHFKTNGETFTTKILSKTHSLIALTWVPSEASFTWTKDGFPCL